jgi:hypothetical protein
MLFRLPNGMKAEAVRQALTTSARVRRPRSPR